MLRWGWPAAMAALFLSCGGESTEPVRLGDVRITLRTEGGDFDLDGYVVTLDSLEHALVGINETLVLRDLAAGPHAIGLTNVADNCDVAGENPRGMTILPNATQTETFDVDCHATGILVSVAQTGADLDEDGFSVAVDDGAPIPVQAGVTRTISRLPPGPHTVTITGVADNCAVGGGTSRTVTVAGRSIEPVTFELGCQAVTGFIEIVVTTTGEDVDADGYRVAVDALPGRLVSTNDSIMIAKLAPGSHTVRLDQLVSNCSTVGTDEQMAAVGIGAITRVAFHVTCSRFEGIVFARGSGISSQIWLVRTDGSAAEKLANGEFPVWAPDGRRLAFLQSDCPYYYYYYFCTNELVMLALGSSEPSLVASVPYGAIDWSPDGGWIVLSGFQFDTRQLYLVDINGASTNALKPVAIPGFNGYSDHPVWSPDGKRLAFTCWWDVQPDICVVNLDGSGLRRLTTDPESDSHPAWSPDGTQLAFATERGHPGGPTIAVIAVDGAGVREITDGMEPSWSPDGTRLVVRKRGIQPGLYLVHVDGTGVVRLTMDGTDNAPAWRP
jgi:hypothetical protein